MADRQACAALTPHDWLDSYVAALFRWHDQFGPHYVRRQCEWAEARVAEILSSGDAYMPGWMRPQAKDSQAS